MLEVKDIELSFSGVKAIQGVSLSVPKGHLLSVIGPNGAGKTSLFNCISAVYRPQKGSILFEGTELVGQKPYDVAAMGVARMFQNLGLFPMMTVLDNLLVGRHHLYKTHFWNDLLFNRHTRQEEIAHRRRCEDVIDFMHLEKYRKTPVAILPYGVRKRVELARALSMEPKLLLLDEPAAGLNQEETELMARYMLDIKDELGITQILIDHDLHFVMDLADSVAVLDFGKKIAEGSPTEVGRNPAVVEAYLGGAAE
ncbi:MAG: ABC transporter ATP-binding protein [Myxococcales bacterium]|nr:ABC transporter ATP-binding protein [Myxococcales bacterium]